VQRRGDAAPREVGGPDGFKVLPETILDPAHEERRAMIERHGGPFDRSGLEDARTRSQAGGIPTGLRAFPWESAIFSLVARGLGQAGWMRTGSAIGNLPALGNGRRIRSGPLRLTNPAGEGRSAREAPASGRPRTATRCCRAASSPLRSSRCAFGSGRTPRCRRERGSHASPPTD